MPKDSKVQDIVGFILSNCARHEVLTPEKEQQYARQYRAGIQDGATPEDRKRGEWAKQRLIAESVRLVVSVAKKRKREEFHIPLEDLIQEGCIGLNAAIERFDPDKGYRLSTYAYWYVRQYVWRSASMHGRAICVPGYLLDKAARIRRKKAEFESSHGRNPTLKELCKITKQTPKALEFCLKNTIPTAWISKERVFEEIQGAEDSDIETEEQIGLIAAWLDTLPDLRTRTAIALFYGINQPPMGLQAIGRRLTPPTTPAKVEALINAGLKLIKKEAAMFEAYYQEPDLMEERILKFIERSNDEVYKAAKAMVPVKTGALKKSIQKTEPVKTGTEVMVSVTAGSDEIDYAYHQEMVNTPFLRPALAAAETELRKVAA